MSWSRADNRLPCLLLGWIGIACSATNAQEWGGPAAQEGQHAYFGIQVQEVDSPMARRLGLRAARGVLVAGIRPGSPAAQADLRPGDIVLRFGNVTTSRVDDLASAMRRADVGSRYRTEILRGGQRLSVGLVAAARPPAPRGVGVRRDG